MVRLNVAGVCSSQCAQEFELKIPVRLIFLNIG